MITLTIAEMKKDGKTLKFQRTIKMFKSKDKAQKFIVPVVEEMRQAKHQKRDPKKNIVAVSYDTNSEKKLLIELGALTLNKEKPEENYY